MKFIEPEGVPADCKWCKVCHVVKPLDAFYVDVRHGKKRKPYCIPCYNARSRSTYATNIDAERARNRAKCHSVHMKQYGLTPEDYTQMETAQNGVCAICGNQCKTRRRLSVDHNHTTGKNRGLLCQSCNVGLGHFGESVPALHKAIEYLQRHNDVLDDCTLAACSG